MIMLRTARGRAATAPLPPEEVKLYAQRVASAIHTWAELADVCRIVDAKSKLPGMMLCKEHLREAVLAELDAKRTALEAQYKRNRVRKQRQLEQAVREAAAAKRQASAVRQRAGARAAAPREDAAAQRKRMRDGTERALWEATAELKELRAAVAPEQPVGPQPKRPLGALQAWKQKQRVHRRHVEKLDKLEKLEIALRAKLGQIGMSRAALLQEVGRRLPDDHRAHAVVPRSPRMVGAGKRYRADGASYPDVVHERGQEEEAAEPERVRLATRDKCGPAGQFSALAHYLTQDDAAPAREPDPLAFYRTHLNGGADPQAFRAVVPMTQQAVEELVGRRQPQTAATERNAMIAATEASAEDYLHWGRPARLRLDKMKAFAEEQERVHAAKQLRHRGRRQVDLENAAEQLEQQPLARRSKAFRVQRALLNKPSQLIVIAPSQAVQVAAALSDTHAVLIWVPDDDPRPGTLTHVDPIRSPHISHTFLQTYINSGNYFQ